MQKADPMSLKNMLNKNLQSIYSALINLTNSSGLITGTEAFLKSLTLLVMI